MKTKSLFFCTFLALCLILSGCGQNEPQDFDLSLDLTDPVESTAGVESFSETMEVTLSDSKQKVTVGDWLKQNNFFAIQYAVIDLNGDGTSETVVQLGHGDDAYYGSLILHVEQETVYAHQLVFRAFYDLKDNGNFFFSSGVSDHGVGRLSFADGGYTVNKLAYCESGADGQISYFIENKAVTKEEFDAYEILQSEGQPASFELLPPPIEE